jgi:hypothetical protein
VECVLSHVIMVFAHFLSYLTLSTRVLNSKKVVFGASGYNNIIEENKFLE